ncbi:arylamine N-acetyltransferase family protein [Microbulbifer taiwanensis]|uniref:Arylamine N-acetyltransferase n=1 Tax=Microbulbifer taiwanensis TaxID=986746 RepID=A0ABW1YUW8_9GAMM|nr:arylamine N-acetyltransferase [Microbulbifer taiwanensis]
MKAAIDLNAYFQRIGYSGDASPDLETVRALIALHTQSIPFENLNPFLGWPVEIDLPLVERKLVRERRGGYCYEQNNLFRAVLEGIGITVTGLAARVLWQVPTNHQPAQSHMMLRAEIAGIPYLVDVGFGSQTPTAPLRLDIETEQATSHGVYRLCGTEGDYLLETRIDGLWLPVYRFDQKKKTAGDYKVFNWYCSTHPASHFVRELVVARAFAGGRHTLRNRELSYYPRKGPKMVFRIASPQELRETLADVFKIEVPDAPEVDSALASLFAPREEQA